MILSLRRALPGNDVIDEKRLDGVMISDDGSVVTSIVSTATAVVKATPSGPTSAGMVSDAGTKQEVCNNKVVTDSTHQHQVSPDIRADGDNRTDDTRGEHSADICCRDRN